MHVIIIRLIEEVRDACDVSLDNDTVYMASVFGEFIAQVILKSRDGGKGAKFEYDSVSECYMYNHKLVSLCSIGTITTKCFQSLHVHVLIPQQTIFLNFPLSINQVTIEANGLSIKCPHQLFVNGEFINSSRTQTYDTINPANEQV